jgi:hypothetical protein
MNALTYRSILLQEMLESGLVSPEIVRLVDKLLRVSIIDKAGKECNARGGVEVVVYHKAAPSRRS